MTLQDVLLSIVINIIPLLIFALPLIFIKRVEYKRLYRRMFYAILIFFAVYWVLPSLFQFDFNVTEFQDVNSNTTQIGIEFLVARSISMFFLFVQYPFLVLPFIFVLSPIISYLILSRRLKHEEGTYAEHFKALSYEYNRSIRYNMKISLQTNDWKKEKELFKGFLILLPISLYLLTVILDIAGIEVVNVSESESPLGWFIEILFVYLATFLFGFQVLNSSKISHKGRFIGEQIQAKFYSSLTEVGSPIAVLSLLLFIANMISSGNPEGILLILFFFAYFLMAAFIFIVLIRIFESISILIFIKIINWRIITESKKENKIEQKKSTNYSPLGILLYGLIAGFIVLFAYFGLGALIEWVPGLVPNGEDFLIQSQVGNQPSFELAILTDVMSSIYSFGSIIVVTLLAFIFYNAVRSSTHLGKDFFFFSAVLLAISAIFGFQTPLALTIDDVWVTGSPIVVELFNINFYTMRMASLSADLYSNTLLLILGAPFILLRPFVNYLLWGFFFIFMRREFTSKSIPHEGELKLLDRITFSKIESIPSISLFNTTPELLVSTTTTKINPQIVQENNIQDREVQLLQQLDQNQGEVVAYLQKYYPGEKDVLYQALLMLSRLKLIEWWVPELKYTFEPAQLDGLYILYSDGRDLLYYNFRKDASIVVEPGLVSGMFSAITAFIQETTKSSELLRAIDSGQKKVLLEYAQDFPIFAALFADRENTEIRKALKLVLEMFVEKHKDHLKNWSGNMSLFENDSQLVETAFSEFLE